MKASHLHIYTARFNPMRWTQPHNTYLEWVEYMLDSGVNLHVVECQYGKREFACDVSKHLHFVGVRADSPAWTKENLINIGLQRSPESEWIAWYDSDVFHEKRGWAEETVEALQIYRIVQPWSQALDRGPNGEILNNGCSFTSFCSQYEKGEPLIPHKHGWKNYGHSYPHPGYAWASTRRVLEYTGGLFELAGCGAADHSMALALVGKARGAAPNKSNQRYIEHLLRWQERIQHAVHGRIGYVPGVINHRFHGRKVNRQYLSRWNMFLRHGFNPDADLKRNTSGVLEWASNKPELERDWMQYLRARQEDANTAD